MRWRHAGLAIVAGLASILMLFPAEASAQRGGGGMRGGGGGAGAMRSPGAMTGGFGGMRGPAGGFRPGGGMAGGPAMGGMRGGVGGTNLGNRGPALGGMRGGAGGMNLGNRGPALGGTGRPGAWGGLNGGNRGLGGPGNLAGGMRPGGGPALGGARPGSNAGGFGGRLGGGGPALGGRAGAGSINWGRGSRVGSMAGLGGGRPGAWGGGPRLGGRPGGGNLGGRYSPTSFNRGNLGGYGGRGLGWRDNYLGAHRGFNSGGRGWGGSRGGFGNLTNINNINNVNWNNWGGGRGWGGGWNRGWGGGWGNGLGWNRGWGNGLGWGLGGLGWGNGLGWGFGSGLGWGLGWGLGNSLGWGLGNWGYGGLGWGNGLGWGLGNWGLGGLGWGSGLGWGGGLGWGNGLGWGLSSWSYGPMLYDWGLTSYYNPYYLVSSQAVGAVVDDGVYDYSQPINPSAPAPDAAVVGSADDLFERGREAFKTGMYTAALDFTAQALKQLPNDPTLHEFRALALFALKRYDEASASLYPVLSLGPGWDWPTLIGLYNNDAAVYTTQVRALEGFVKESPNTASSHFLLGYHYLCQGHGEEALRQLRAASKLQPKDSLSAKLVESLEEMRRKALGPAADAKPADAKPAPAIAAATPAVEPLPAAAVAPGTLDGTWTATADEHTRITLDLSKADRFGWTVDHDGAVKTFQGVRSQGGGYLTLVQEADASQPPMVGRLEWKDDDHFDFHLTGTPPSDPGLTFSRSR